MESTKYNEFKNPLQLQKFNSPPSRLTAILGISDLHILCRNGSKAPCFCMTLSNKYSTTIWDFTSTKYLYVCERKRGGKQAFLSFRGVIHLFFGLKVSFGQLLTLSFVIVYQILLSKFLVEQILKIYLTLKIWALCLQNFGVTKFFKG